MSATTTANAIRSALEDITCCRLRAIHYPGGTHLSHADSCPEFPKMKVRDSHPALRRLNPRPDAFEAHKKCVEFYARGLRVCTRCAPLLHDDGCRCGACLYASAHSDDAPDWGRA